MVEGPGVIGRMVVEGASVDGDRVIVGACVLTRIVVKGACVVGTLEAAPWFWVVVPKATFWETI